MNESNYNNPPLKKRRRYPMQPWPPVSIPSHPQSHHPIIPAYSPTSPKTNPYKLLPTNPALARDIELLNHSPQLLLLQSLAQLPRHPSQIIQLNPAFTRLIEQFKGAQDLFARVAREDALGGDGGEGCLGEEEARWARECRLLLLLLLLVVELVLILFGAVVELRG